jgi:hypothetical protein
MALGAVGVAGVGGSTAFAHMDPTTVTDADILNFALNLEYPFYKVEIAGTMASDKMHGSMDKSKPAAEMHDSINVKSVKMLASSCP